MSSHWQRLPSSHSSYVSRIHVVCKADRNQVDGQKVVSTQVFPLYNTTETANNDVFNTTDTIFDMDNAYPYRRWTVSPSYTGIISTGFPIVAILLMQVLRIRDRFDTVTALMGLFTALSFSSLSQVTIKVLIGGFRPWFLDVCKPDITLAASHNSTGLQGSGFNNMFYTAEICTGKDSEIQTALRSFPSGHSAGTMAGFGFLFLYMNAKLKVWSNFRPAMWKMVLLFIPVVGAFLQVCVLTVDYAHHWYDIFVGSAIGLLYALSAYRLHYAGVWDWRYNHIPLRYSDPMDYDFADVDEDYTGRVCTRKARWGLKPTAEGNPWLTRREPEGGQGKGTGMLSRNQSINGDGGLTVRREAAPRPSESTAVPTPSSEEDLPHPIRPEQAV